jgi:hypothetical protein
VRCVYDPAKTSLQRLLLSGVLPAQQQQELTEVAHALALYAGKKRATIARKKGYNPDTGKYDFRTFLLRLGFIGEEFKNARDHLLANMKGDRARKNPKVVGEEPAAPAAPSVDTAGNPIPRAVNS